jgi:diguanylate cyclase (GGDEF)-like protein/PAS domain S-box-containing protein
MSPGAGLDASWHEPFAGPMSPWFLLPGLVSTQWADPVWRTRLVAKTRWVLLGFLSLYGAYACALFWFSPFGFFFTAAQLAFLFASVAGVASYNLLLQTRYSAVRRVPFIDHLQILLDLVFITVIIHFSGGPASWFWPVYLIATIEAAFLLPRPRDVWMVGAFGGAVYGVLLAGHYLGVLHPIHMPFVPEALPVDGLFLALTWFWVALMNAAVAFITAYLMSVIREEHHALGESQERLQNFVDTANDLIFSVTPSGRIRYVNPVWTDVLGYRAEDLAALRLPDLIEVGARTQCLIEFRRAISGEKGTVLAGELVAKDGRRIAVEGNIACTFKDGRPALVWCICRDISERKAAEQQLYQLAHFDTLTGLPNRATLVGQIDTALALARRSGKRSAVLFLDLDRFKLINDTLGHSGGDELLKAVGKRLRGAVRETDAVSRIGGDEFIVATLNLNSPADITALANKLLKPLSMHFEIGGHELFVTASIGISVFPEDGDDSEALIKKADIAMYHAKRRGRNNYQFYNAKMDEDAGRRLLLTNDIRRALERGEFRVHYQPKLDTRTCRITSLEALLRWAHPELGLLPPAEFIPLAEETGLILPLGEWVLARVAEQHMDWKREGLPPIPVGVNLSGYQLQQASFIETVKRILGETGMNPENLEFEITETVVMQNPDLAANVLKEFSQLGIRISIDDFGTGYSSLAHIKRFALSSLKIDKSFVKDLETNHTDAAIATAIIAMGSSLNLQVVAEGVETEGQLHFLREKACDEVQGFLFSEPLPAEEITRHLRADRGRGSSTARRGLHPSMA